MYKTRPFFRTVALVILMLASLSTMADKQEVRRLAKDSLTVVTSPWQETPSARMAQSAYPVKLMVKGRSLRITSKHEQVLPIYTQGGVLYLAMQLTPGVN